MNLRDLTDQSRVVARATRRRRGPAKSRAACRRACCAPLVPAALVSQSDEEFITKAVIGGLAEVEMGKLAKQRASSPNVRKFAGHMVADHEKANHLADRRSASVASGSSRNRCSLH
jgi:predicted outer membrane protein